MPDQPKKTAAKPSPAQPESIIPTDIDPSWLYYGNEQFTLNPKGFENTDYLTEGN